MIIIPVLIILGLVMRIKNLLKKKGGEETYTQTHYANFLYAWHTKLCLTSLVYECDHVFTTRTLIVMSQVIQIF